MKPLLFSLLVLFSCALAAPGHEKLDYGVPHSHTFTEHERVKYYYIDVREGETLTLEADTETPVEMFLSQDEHPSPWKSSWYGVDYFELGPLQRNYYPGRFYVAIQLKAQDLTSDITVAITGHSNVKMIAEIPTTGVIGEDGYAYFKYPLCSAGVFNVSIAPGSNAVGLFICKLYSHPTDTHSTYKFDGKRKASIDFKSSGFVYIGVNGEPGETVAIIGTDEHELDPIELGKEVSGELIRGCARNYKISNLDSTTEVPMTIIADNDYHLYEMSLYMSYNEHNPFPSPLDYDDHHFLEVGGVVVQPSLHFIDGTAYMSVVCRSASSWVPKKFAFIVSQQHYWIYEGYEKDLHVPTYENSEGLLLVSSRVAAHRGKAISAEIDFAKDRQDDNFSFMVMASSEDPNVAFNDDDCFTAYGFTECERDFEAGETVRMFWRVLSKYSVPGGPPVPAPFLHTLIYEIELCEPLTGSMDRDEFVSFYFTLPAQETGWDVIIKVTTGGRGHVDMFASRDQIPNNHYHEWACEPKGFERTIVIPADDIEWGVDQDFRITLYAVTRAEYTIKVYSDHYIEVTDSMKVQNFVQNYAIKRFFYIPPKERIVDGAAFIFAMIADASAPISMYVSTIFDMPDDEMYDWKITPTSGAVLVKPDDGAYRHDLGTHFMSVLHGGANNVEAVEYSLIAAAVSPLSDNRLFIDWVEAGNVKVFMFQSDAPNTDHFIEFQGIAPIGTQDKKTRLSVYVGTTDLGTSRKYDYALLNVEAGKDPRMINMLHADGVRGSKGAAPGTFFVTVVGHGLFNMFEIRRFSSLNIELGQRVPYSVLNNEYQYFNVRVSSNEYARLSDGGYLDITLSPTGTYERDCLERLTTYASITFHHPSEYVGYDWGEKGKQNIRIKGSDKNLKVGRLYISVKGETSGCAFEIQASSTSTNYKSGSVWSWIVLFLVIGGLLSALAYGFVYFKNNPQSVPKWASKFTKSSSYDTL